MLEIEVYVTLKSTIADPQGLTVKHALDSLGYKEIEDVRIGKLITLKLNLDNREQAEKQIDSMCKKLLSNPIIEDYTFKIKEAK